MLEGILISSKAVQSENTLLSSVFIESGDSTLVNEVQFPDAP